MLNSIRGLTGNVYQVLLRDAMDEKRGIKNRQAKRNTPGRSFCIIHYKVFSAQLCMTIIAVDILPERLPLAHGWVLAAGSRRNDGKKKNNNNNYNQKLPKNKMTGHMLCTTNGPPTRKRRVMLYKRIKF